jgi:hypothetical protein
VQQKIRDGANEDFKIPSKRESLRNGPIKLSSNIKLHSGGSGNVSIKF